MIAPLWLFSSPSSPSLLRCLSQSSYYDHPGIVAKTINISCDCDRVRGPVNGGLLLVNAVAQQVSRCVVYDDLSPLSVALQPWVRYQSSSLGQDIEVSLVTCGERCMPAQRQSAEHQHVSPYGKEHYRGTLYSSFTYIRQSDRRITVPLVVNTNAHSALTEMQPVFHHPHRPIWAFCRSVCARGNPRP